MPAAKFVKATNNESGTLTALLSDSETTTANLTPVPAQAPGYITLEIGTDNEEEIYYATKDDGAGTISTLIRDTSNLNGGLGREHQNGAAWETAQSATYINGMVDGLTAEHNASDGKHKSALVTTLKASGAEINTGTEDAKIVTPKAIADSNVVLTTKTQTLTNKAITHSINTQTDNYTLVLTDQSKIVVMNKGTAINLTVPANADVAFPTGTVIGIISIGAGLTTVVAAGGVTVNVDAAYTLVLKAAHACAVLIKRDTNTWVLAGDLEAA